MYKLLKLQVPSIPLLAESDSYNLENINSYLHALVGYCYSCNELVVQQDEVIIGVSPGGGRVDGWSDGVLSAINHTLTISSLYNGGSIIFKLSRRGAAAGTAIMSYNAYRLRNNAPFLVIAAGVAINYTPGNTNTNTLSITLSSTNLTAGDILRFDIVRDGANAGDTMVGDVANDAVTVSFV